jgi:hypothetical protein
VYEPAAMRCITGGSKSNPAAPKETTTGPWAQDLFHESCAALDMICQN